MSIISTAALDTVGQNKLVTSPNAPRTGKKPSGDYEKILAERQRQIVSQREFVIKGPKTSRKPNIDCLEKEKTERKESGGEKHRDKETDKDNAFTVVENVSLTKENQTKKKKKNQKQERPQQPQQPQTPQPPQPPQPPQTPQTLEPPQRGGDNAQEKKEPEAVQRKKVEINREPSPQGKTVQYPIGQSSLASEVAKARQHIKKSLECMDSLLSHVPNDELVKKLTTLETEMKQMKIDFNAMQNMVKDLKSELNQLRQTIKTVPIVAICPPAPTPAAAGAPKPPADDDDDDGVDLFASDSEDDEEAAKIRDQRLAEYAAKKSKKPALIAKSNIILDVKPWDDETDMAKMEEMVRTVTTDGLLWGASKLVPLAFGIKKLQISCVVEDDKVSVDWIQEEIEKFEDYVQSVDIAAFNKI